MAELFLHQQRKGGIIDPEAEDTKMLLRTDDDDTSTSNPHPGTSFQSTSKQTAHHSQNHHRNHHRNRGRGNRGSHYRRHFDRVKQMDFAPR